MIEDFVNQIHHGDCLKVLQDIPDKSIDLLVTDPPYVGDFRPGKGFLGKRVNYAVITEKVGSSLKFDFSPYLEALRPKLKIFNAYIWCSYKMLHLIIGFAMRHKFNYDLLTWQKLNPAPLKNNTYIPETEHCVFIREPRAYFNNDNSFAMYRKVFSTGINKSEFGHPTEKPIKIIIPSILNSSREGDIVLDPFSGSGTIAAACVRFKRKFIGIEDKLEFVEMGRKRVHQEKLQTTLF